MEALDIRLLILLVVGSLVAGAAIAYRRLRARSLPDVTEVEFLERFYLSHEGARDCVLEERRRVASILSVPAEKLSPDQTLNELARRFGFLAEFSVAANDLYAEAAEMRRIAGLGARESVPDTIGEVIEDLTTGREVSKRTQGAGKPDGLVGH
jgi:hypothetical protein